MIREIGAVLAGIGSVSVLYGILWFFWDEDATPPIYFMTIGLFAVLLGWAMTG